MINCSQKVLISLLQRARVQDCYEKALAKAGVEYQLKPYNIMKLQPDKILQIFRLIHKKFYCELKDNEMDFWVENQLRIFVWVVIVYAFLQLKRIEEFNAFHWSQLHSIFSTKRPITLQFQSLCLLRHRKPKKWSEEEIKLLEDSIKQREEKNRWNQIAKEIFVKSNKKYFRTPKQCREQWLNHLDPTKSKSQWTLIEDYQLIKNIIKNGRKWSKVAKQIGNRRTEHMVKNRYKSLINTEMKRLADIDGEQFLITKIRQRLQSHSSVRKFLAQQHNKQLRKQSSILIQPDKLLDVDDLIADHQQNSTLSCISYDQNEQNYVEQEYVSKSERIEMEAEPYLDNQLKNQQSPWKNIKNNQQWALKQEPDIDELDIEEFFNKELHGQFYNKNNYFLLPASDLD